MTPETSFAPWRPGNDYVRNSNISAFNNRFGLGGYDQLLERSVADPAWFWDAVIRHFGIRFLKPYEKVLDLSEGAPFAKWCVGGTTNIALNCLDRQTDLGRQAILWEGEDGTVRAWDYGELRRQVARLAAGLRGLGLGRSDVVALYMPMLPETAAAFFAVAKIGGIVLPLFSGFGPEAAAARLNDAGAKAILTVDGTRRRGKVAEMKAAADEAVRLAPSVRHVVILKHLDIPIAWTPRRDHWWHELCDGRPDEAPTEEMPADDPFMLVYTSGTTGKAKGTVHTHCGFLTKLAADFGLSLDFKPSDRFLWMSDMGWVVGPMQVVVASFFGGTVVMAEGTPDYPDPERLWRLTTRHHVTYLGLAPTIARTLMRHGPEAVRRHNLDSLRIVVSSGEPWNPDSWLWFFEHVCRRRVPILNVSGGTEIGWGIVTADLFHRFKPCSFGGPCLGMGAEVVDERGRPVAPGQVGELALRLPSIGLTRGLWRDRERYLESYWSKIPGLWVHGDFASIDADGLWYIHGRSDDTLKLAGKRTGPAEIESLVISAGLAAEAAACGVHDTVKGQALVLACVPRGVGEAGSADAERIAEAIVKGFGAPYRPQRVVFVSQLPKTRNMKTMRRVVRAVFEGSSPGDLASLVNPEAVEELKARLAGPAG
jgi:acetyl-CoA synthetase